MGIVPPSSRKPFCVPAAGGDGLHVQVQQISRHDAPQPLTKSDIDGVQLSEGLGRMCVVNLGSPNDIGQIKYHCLRLAACGSF